MKGNFPAMMDIAMFVAQNNRVLVLNLSAEYLCLKYTVSNLNQMTLTLKLTLIISCVYISHKFHSSV